MNKDVISEKTTSEKKHIYDALENALKERKMYYEKMDTDETEEKYCCICDENIISNLLEEMNYDEVSEGSCNGIVLWHSEEIKNKKPSAIAIICNKQYDELISLEEENGIRFPGDKDAYAELSLLCSNSSIRTGQGNVLLLMSLAYILYNLEKNHMYLKVAIKNKEKLIPFYTKMGFKKIETKTTNIYMVNTDIKKTLLTFDFDKLKLRTKKVETDETFDLDKLSIG
jgi:predicted lactoylglutathione lyase